MKQTYRVAGLVFQMDASGMTEARAKKYRIEPQEEPLFEIPSAPERYKEKYLVLSEEERQYLFTGHRFYRQLLQYGGMMLHSSAVVVDGKAYLFTADSGTGKSTHTALWLDYFGENAYILNDDKPALKLENGIWYAYGTPWSGKHDLSQNIGVPVGGIALLQRGKTNEIFPCGGILAIQKLLKQTVRPAAKEERELLLENLDILLRDIPIWELSCNMDLEAAKVAYEAMSKGEK